MIPPRYKKPLWTLFTIFLVLFIIVIVPQAIQIKLIPDNLKLVPGQKINLSIKKPFSIFLTADRPDGIIGLNGTEKLKKGESGYCSLVTVNPEVEGRCLLEFRFLGVPIRRVNLLVMKMPEVIPGGHAIGVLLSQKGVVISGHLPVRDAQGKEYYPAQDAGIKVGDLLVAINDCTITHLGEVDNLIQSRKGLPLKLTIIRDEKLQELQISPIKRVNPDQRTVTYLLGLYIEDPAAGVGTLTYYDAKTGKYGALGHKIIGFGNREIPLVSGKIVSARITGINLSNRGEPGEKIGVFSGNTDIIGEITANTHLGIFGKLVTNIANPYYTKPISVATISEVTPGPAEIHTVISGDEIRRFSVEIQKVYYQTNLKDKGMVIKVTDPELLLKTGGIVQGMSGSPVIQNGKLVGAITHVFVNDPTRGYGVFAEWMLQISDNLLETERKKAS